MRMSGKGNKKRSVPEDLVRDGEAGLRNILWNNSCLEIFAQAWLGNLGIFYSLGIFWEFSGEYSGNIPRDLRRLRTSCVSHKARFARPFGQTLCDTPEVLGVFGSRSGDWILFVPKRSDEARTCLILSHIVGHMTPPTFAFFGMDFSHARGRFVLGMG